MEGSIICLSKDDSYRQICSLNRVHVPSDYSLTEMAICFYMSEGFGVKASITQHSGTFVMQVAFFITELKITGFHCSCMSMTLHK